MMKSWLFLVVGIIYGAALVFIAFVLSGVGHGSYLLFVVAGAPVSFFAFLSPLVFWAALILPLVMWGVVGWLLGSSSGYRQRFAIGITVFHYISWGYILIAFPDPDGRFISKMFTYERPWGFVGAAIYLVGQIVIWVYWITRTRLR